MKCKEITTNNGIFHNIYLLHPDEIPWDDALLISGDELDVLYKFHSGEKTLYLDITDDSKENVANYVWILFKRKWEMYYKALMDEYNPFENYNISEDERSYTQDDRNSIENQDSVNDRQYRKDSTISENNKQQENNSSLTVDDSISNSNENEKNLNFTNDKNQYFGFNSSSGSDQNASYSDEGINRENVNSSIDNNTQNGYNENINRESKNKDEIQREINNDFENRKIKSTENAVGTKKRSDIFHGINGNTTVQSLISETLDVYRKVFFDAVFDDVDSAITILCY